MKFEGLVAPTLEISKSIQAPNEEQPAITVSAFFHQNPTIARGAQANELEELLRHFFEPLLECSAATLLAMSNMDGRTMMQAVEIALDHSQKAMVEIRELLDVVEDEEQPPKFHA